MSRTAMSSEPTVSEVEYEASPGSRPGGQRRPVWRQTLVDVETGLKRGLRADASLAILLFIHSVVLAGAWVAGLSVPEWAFVLLALTIVLASLLAQQMLRILHVGLSAADSPELRLAVQFGVAACILAGLGAYGTVALLLIPRLAAMLV